MSGIFSSEISGRLRAALDDRYRIERELGAGGKATVHLAVAKSSCRWAWSRVPR